MTRGLRKDACLLLPARFTQRFAVCFSRWRPNWRLSLEHGKDTMRGEDSALARLQIGDTQILLRALEFVEHGGSPRTHFAPNRFPRLDRHSPEWHRRVPTVRSQHSSCASPLS